MNGPSQCQVRSESTKEQRTSGKLCRLQFCMPIKSSTVALRRFMLGSFPCRCRKLENVSVCRVTWED
jgi:hypothetical protein